MNIDQQLASLCSALDDVLDLERGLADAVLPRAHTDLVTGLDDAVDIVAGLARVVSPPQEPVPLLPGLTAFADELATRPAAERLAARSRLPMALLIEARDLSICLPEVRALCDTLVDTRDFEAVRADLLEVALRVNDALGASPDMYDTPRRLVQALQLEVPQHAAGLACHLALALDAHCGERLAAVLSEISIKTHSTDSLPLDVAPCTAALTDVIDRVLSALTSMIGADLSAADLSGLPLDGVQWSSDTRWPEDWEAWVRENSLPVAADVFEIRPGKAGSWLPT